MALIVDARVAAFELPLRDPLETAHGLIATRRGAVLRLRTADGLEGWGEATPIPGFGVPDADATRAALETNARDLVGHEPEAIWPPRVQGEFPDAAFALETAVADLCARRVERPLACWLAEGSAAEAVPVNALISGLADAESAVADGFETLKCKVGSRDFESDLERLRALRAAVPPRIRLRVDANQAWSLADAVTALDALAALDIECVEEPLCNPTPSLLAELRSRSSVRIASDESALSRGDFEAQLAIGAVDRYVLKPGAVGGLVEARARAEACRRAGVEVVVTSGLDGAIAGLAALHLAASLPGPLPACGLATAGRLASDLCRAPTPVCGRLIVPTRGGLGDAPDPAALGRVAA